MPVELDEQIVAEHVERAVRGDGDALQRLIVHYHSILHAKVAAKIDGVAGRRIDADDVLQQAYISALESVSGCSFDGPGGFYKWLETTAFNKLHDQQRDMHRQRRDVGREVHERPTAATAFPGLIDRFAARDSTPSRIVGRSEATAAVMSCIARLSDDQRTLVKLRFIEERSVPEVAAAMDKSDAAIHMLTHRTLKELRRLMVSLTRFLSRL